MVRGDVYINFIKLFWYVNIKNKFKKIKKIILKYF